MQIRKLTHLAALGGLALLSTACDKPAEEAPAAVEAAPSAAILAAPAAAEAPAAAFETVDQRASYGIGFGVGSNVGGQDVFQVDVDALIAGLKDGLAMAEPQLDEATLQAAFAELEGRATAKAAEAEGANLAVADAFLQANALRDGVKVTASGLQYEILSASTDPDAPKPTASDTVEVHYHGTLIDGTVFDSSIERGEPISFPVGGVIQGWVEALQLMSVGDTWKLTIPPALAYGPRQAGAIPPNSALIFEVRLLGIVAEEPPPAM